MTALLTIVRYPRFLGWAGFLSMALFRVPLFFHKKISFGKLLGCGKNGTFDIHPDWRQWAVLTVTNDAYATQAKSSIALQQSFYGAFIPGWWRFFKCETCSILLDPVEGHGTWNGKTAFGNLPRQTTYEGQVAVLTRATIRLKKLRNFWKNVAPVAAKMSSAEGFITSIGIGEMPWIKQATFSVWTSKNHMKAFAYKMNEHQAVIHKTKKENWYSEEMFVRFRVLQSFGTLRGKNPFKQ